MGSLLLRREEEKMKGEERGEELVGRVVDRGKIIKEIREEIDRDRRREREKQTEFIEEGVGL